MNNFTDLIMALCTLKKNYYFLLKNIKNLYINFHRCESKVTFFLFSNWMIKTCFSKGSKNHQMVKTDQRLDKVP